MQEQCIFCRKRSNLSFSSSFILLLLLSLSVLVHVIRDNNTADSVPERLKCVQTIIKQSSEESVGFVANARQNKFNNEELSQLSKGQKDIRVKIQNTKDNKTGTA